MHINEKLLLPDNANKVNNNGYEIIDYSLCLILKNNLLCSITSFANPKCNFLKEDLLYLRLFCNQPINIL